MVKLSNLVCILGVAVSWSGISIAYALPTSVTVISDFQNELGCPGDFQADCVNTHLSYDQYSSVWKGAFYLPAGDWEYKLAINDSLDENYGANALLNGPNIPLSLETATSVKFYYDNNTHWITDNVNSVIATLVGNFQSEIGCAGDFDPTCLRGWLQDIDGNGIYQFITTDIPMGSYDVLVVHNESFDEYYGQGGAYKGGQISFYVPDSATTCFSYNSLTHILDISIGSCAIHTIPEPAPITLISLSFILIGYRQRKKQANIRMVRKI